MNNVLISLSLSCDLQNHWSSMFSGVVSRASTIDVLSTGVAGNFNGALQVVINGILLNLSIIPIDNHIKIIRTLCVTVGV